MKILLDESVPVKLRNDFPATHEAWTVRDKGWSGKKNGELLRLMTDDKFEIFITVDQNLAYQQNIGLPDIIVVVFCAKDNHRQTLSLLIPVLMERLTETPVKKLIQIS